MASSGPLYAGTGANFNDGGNQAWANPTNAQGDTTDTNASCALPSNPSTSQRLRASNFGFNIPTGATIDGVITEIEYNASANNRCRDNSVRLLVAGVEDGDEHSIGANWTTTKTINALGGETDTWGIALTPAIVNATGFGVSAKAERYHNSAVTARIYRVRITVYYTEPLSVNTSDSITITESSTALINQLYVDVTDEVTVTDVPTVNLPIDGWYNASWGYRVKVTVLASRVDANLTDYPVYVDLSELPAGFHTNVNQTDARDIRVTTSDGTTEVPREVVFYAAATDTGELHFKGSVNATTDTDFYIYYGNASATEPAVTDTYGRNNTWNSNYIAVYHLNEAVNNDVGGYVDSSGGGNHGQGVSMAISAPAGKLSGKCAEFDGSADRIGVPKLLTNDTWSASGWVWQDALSGANGTAIFYQGSGSNDLGSEFGLIDNYPSAGQEPLFARSGGSTLATGDDVNHTTGNWYHITGTFNNTAAAFYFNGAAAGTPTVSGGTHSDNTGSIGAWYAYTDVNRFIDGKIDELRIRDDVAASTWISTEYNNQNSPSTFFTIGSQEESTSTDLSVNVSDTVTITEDIQVVLSRQIDAFDTLTLTEDSTVTVFAPPAININVNDGVTVTEFNDIVVNAPVTPQVNVNDEIALTEDTTILITNLSISLDDQITIEESSTVNLGTAPPLNVNTFEELTTTEDTGVLINNLVPTVNDTVTISEDSTVRTTIYINTSDEIVTTEDVTVQINVAEPINVSTSDEITLNEFTSVILTSFISKDDEIVLTENITVIIPTLFVSNDDQITISESPTVAVGSSPPLNIDIFDDVTVSEDVSVFINQLVPTAFDIVTITESLTLVINILYLGVLDELLVTEQTTVLINFLNILASDEITVSEDLTVTIGALPAFEINVSDEITIEDVLPFVHSEEIIVTDDSTVVVVGTKSIEVSDGIDVTDNSTVFIPVLTPEASDEITVTEDLDIRFTSFIDVNDGVTITEDSIVQVNAPGTLEISANDELTITEIVTVSLQMYLGVLDEIVVSEDVTVTIPTLTLSVDDQIIISESPTIEVGASPPFNIDVFDDAITSDEATILINELYAEVLEDITVTENVNVIINTLYISTDDEVVVTDTSTILINQLYIDTSDGLVTTDISNVLINNLFIEALDNVTITESSQLNIDINVNESDNLSISEDVSINAFDPQLNVNVSDEITVEDVLPFYHPETITVEDDGDAQIDGLRSIDEADEITLTENVSVFIPTLVVEVSDNVTLAEDSQVNTQIYVNADDTLTITDSSAVEILTVPALTINTNDTITLSEDSTVFITSYGISVSDNVTITQSSSVVIPTLYVNESDDVVITENINVDVKTYINESDEVTITENTDVTITTLHIDTNDEITISENSTVETSAVLVLSIDINDEISISEDSGVFVTSLIVKASDNIIVTETHSLQRRSKTWYEKAFIVFQVSSSVDWSNKNNTNWKNKQPSNWYDKIKQKWYKVL